MKRLSKIFSLFVFLMITSFPAFAGGLVTNTNMSAAYLRNPAREALNEVDGVYFNPAGTAFLEDGLHAYVSSQTVFQQRILETEFEPFKLNKDDMNAKHKYIGKTMAPVVPTIHIAYNWDRWNAQFGFNIIGGGGKCEYGDGLGMFERSLAAQTAGLKSAIGQNVAYSLSSSITGKAYQFGVFLGTSYEIIKDKLSVSVGAQMAYVANHYTGGLKDMKMWMGDGYNVPASTALQATAQQLQQVDPTTAATLNAVASQIATIPDVVLDCKQKGFGITPVLGVDYKVSEKLNLSFRYQFNNRIKLKNEADNSQAAQANEALANFQDGKKLRADIPGYLNVGVAYAPTEKLRLSAAYRFFDEKNATRETANKVNTDNTGTHEPCVGIEWDVIKLLTLSCGYQAGIYGMKDKEMSEMDFQIRSNSILAGFRINLGEHFKIDLGYMHSFYGDRTVTSTVSNLPYKTKFTRKNDLVGIGLALAF